jgi:hypothetical protein
VEAIGSGRLTYKYATSVAVDPAGNPHISYYDQRNQDLALGSRGEAGWSIAAVDDEGDTGLFSSMVIDGEGRFHIGYFQRKSPFSGVVKYATRGPDDSDWGVRSVDFLGKLKFGAIGARNITSVAVDTRGNPWIAYSDMKFLKVAIWTGSEWRIESVVEAGSRTLGQLVSLKLDSLDHPHITYFEVTGEQPLSGVIMYAKGTPTREPSAAPAPASGQGTPARPEGHFLGNEYVFD